jgi:protein MpaA
VPPRRGAPTYSAAVLTLRRLAPLLLTAALLAPTGPVATASPSVAPGGPTTAVAPSRDTGVLERVLLGRSVEGRAIWAYRKGDPEASRVVVVVGQMHGDETAGVVTARSLRARIPAATRADVWIVPTMNPDGLALGSRYNARGVDLNRNWPTNWEPGSTAGSGPASEPETRAMRRFLKRVDPTFVASLHQPFGVIGRSDKNMRYVRRLSRELALPIARVQVGDCYGRDCPPTPTMTSWFNARRDGYCVTIELERDPSRRYLRNRAARGILRATFAV